MDVYVIGGGIHGVSSALALANEGLNVTVVERNDQILAGTSSATHNRAHLGYHYPRSDETAVECLAGLETFKKKFPESLHYPREAYYIIAKEGSKINGKQFEQFCARVGIPYDLALPSAEIVNPANVDTGFKVNEPVFDIRTLRSSLERKIGEMGIRVLTGSELVGSENISGKTGLYISTEGKSKLHKADLVLNATYAYSNNTLDRLGLSSEMRPYRLQETEVAVIRSDEDLPALTIMDGPFISIMPFANQPGLHLVYSVANSVLREERGYIFTETERKGTNFPRMIADGKKFLPFLENVDYVHSLYGTRPICPEAVGDCRASRIVRHRKNPQVYSIEEGKFISALAIADTLVKTLKQDGAI